MRASPGAWLSWIIITSSLFLLSFWSCVSSQWRKYSKIQRMTPAPEQDPPISSPLELVMTPGNWWLCSSTSHLSNGEGQVGDRDRYNYFFITRENNGPIIFSWLLVMVTGLNGVQFCRKSYEREQNWTTAKRKSDMSITSVNGNTITTFLKTKNKERRKKFFWMKNIFLRYCKYITLPLVCFCLFFQPFFFTLFNKRRPQMSCII